MGIETRLGIREENVKIFSNNINITCELKHKRNYTDEGSLESFNLFADDITGKHDIIPPILIIYRKGTIILNINQIYHMMQLITNEKCAFPTKDYQYHSK